MIVRGMNLPLIIACITIVLALIVFPLIVSFKAEKKMKTIMIASLIFPKLNGKKLKNIVRKLIKKLGITNNLKCSNI